MNRISALGSECDNPINVQGDMMLFLRLYGGPWMQCMNRCPFSVHVLLHVTCSHHVTWRGARDLERCVKEEGAMEPHSGVAARLPYVR